MSRRTSPIRYNINDSSENLSEIYLPTTYDASNNSSSYPSSTTSLVKPQNNYAHNPKDIGDIERASNISNNSRNSKTSKSDKDNDKKRGFCCCCIPRTKKGKIIFGIALLLFIVTLVLILYFFIPRTPDIEFHTVQIDNSAGSLYSIQLPEGDNNVFSVSANANLNISVINTNYYGLKVNKMTVNLYILGNQTVNGKVVETEKPFGVGILQDTWFPRRSTIQVFIPISVGFYYENGYKEAIVDPGLTSFMNACGVELTGEEMERGSFKVHYKAVAYVKGLENINIKPKFESIVNVGCPFSVSSVEQIKSEIQDLFLSS